MDDLDDFRYYFSAEGEIDAFVAADNTLKGQEQKISGHPKWGSRRMGVLEPHMRMDMSGIVPQLAEQS